MTPPRVVFDCNIFLQALSSPVGPAGRCVQMAFDGKLRLFVSARVLDELRDVCARPKVKARLKLRPDSLQAIIESIQFKATALEAFPDLFEYPRDPDDAHYVNLALAAHATFLVSRDQDLLDLMNPAQPESAAFQTRFPLLRILDPVAFLREIEESV